MPTVSDVESLVTGVRAGDRVRIGQALTLVESRRTDHQEAAATLLDRLLPFTGNSRRIGITGTPGAGKSTFIDAYGCRLADAGARVAVLAVDPSSAQSGGSLLGDKTRMEKLAVHPNAFIRPSPTRGVLGGVAERTREAILVLEAAGYDHLFVETVGVGQSETFVADLVDCFVLLVLPGGGDEVQGLKRGIMEHADVLIVHKSDLDVSRTREAVRAYRGALHLFPTRSNGWQPKVFAVSSTTGEGFERLDALLETFFTGPGRSSAIAQRRAEQRLTWLRQTLRNELLRRFYADSSVTDKLPDLERAVENGEIDVRVAVERLMSG